MPTTAASQVVNCSPSRLVPTLASNRAVANPQMEAVGAMNFAICPHTMIAAIRPRFSVLNWPLAQESAVEPLWFLAARVIQVASYLLTAATISMITVTIHLAAASAVGV
jgi:hypothetical protein